MKKLSVYFMAVLLLASPLLAWGSTYYEEIKAYLPGTEIFHGDALIFLENAPLLYEDKLYVPLREFCEILDIDLVWDGEGNTVHLNFPKALDAMPPANSLAGEAFIYGQIMKIDYGNRSIHLEQHLDHNSREVFEALTVQENAVILIKRNQHYLQVSLEDVRVGDVVGMIITEEAIVRGIIAEL